MNLCKIEIFRGSPSLYTPVFLEITYSNFHDFKVKLLKRFGNIEGSNKAERERQKVKQAIKNAKNFREVKVAFENSRHWDAKLRRE